MVDGLSRCRRQLDRRRPPRRPGVRRRRLNPGARTQHRRLWLPVCAPVSAHRTRRDSLLASASRRKRSDLVDRHRSGLDPVACRDSVTAADRRAREYCDDRVNPPNSRSHLVRTVCSAGFEAPFLELLARRGEVPIVLFSTARSTGSDMVRSQIFVLSQPARPTLCTEELLNARSEPVS